ncbi:ANTAR domain-containing protein [Mycobacterium sp. 050134]|uniref:ANTAR domain-containing protein n=1 Tax=Mycobacterium sp. 050134 TaxID=3096111 RepID=UPI002ED84CA1
MIEGLTSRAPLRREPRETRRVLDTAVGILVGWRRCSTDAAFQELIAASERHRVGAFAMASSLVTLASGGAVSAAAGGDAQLAAEREWGLNVPL